jgi:dGTPase
LPLWAELTAELKLDPCTELSDMARHRVIRALIGWGVTDAVTTTGNRLAAEGIDSLERLRSRGRPVLGFSEPVGSRLRELRQILWQSLYRHWRVVRMAAKAQRVLQALFRAYIDEPAQLPRYIQSRLAAAGETPERVVCDYVAGMTDRFALEEHARLFDPAVRV